MLSSQCRVVSNPPELYWWQTTQNSWLMRWHQPYWHLPSVKSPKWPTGKPASPYLEEQRTNLKEVHQCEFQLRILVFGGLKAFMVRLFYADMNKNVEETLNPCKVKYKNPEYWHSVIPLAGLQKATRLTLINFHPKTERKSSRSDKKYSKEAF